MYYLIYNCNEYGRQWGDPLELVISNDPIGDVRRARWKKDGHGFTTAVLVTREEIRSNVRKYSRQYRKWRAMMNTVNAATNPPKPKA